MRCIKIVAVEGLNKSVLTTFKRLQTYTHSWNKSALIAGMWGYCISSPMILEIHPWFIIPLSTYLGELIKHLGIGVIITLTSRNRLIKSNFAIDFSKVTLWNINSPKS